MADDNIVQENVVSEETTLVEGDSPEGGEAEQPLTEAEKVRQIVQEAVDKAMAGAKREIQSVKDKATAEVDRALNRASLAEGTLAGINKGFKELDPEAAESARLKAENDYYRRMAATQQQAQANKALEDELIEHLQDLGIDPKDERLDWAKDIKEPGLAGYMKGKKRFDKSVADILKGNAKASQEELAQEKKRIEAKEVDSVETSASAGVRGKLKRQEIIKRYSEGDPSISTEDYKKAMNRK